MTQSLIAPKFGPHIWSLMTDEKLRAGLAQTERNAQQFATHYCVASTFPAQRQESALRDVWMDIAALQMSYGRRLATIYCDSIEALARKRLHLAALALRAHLELTGALLHFEQRLTKRLVAGVSTQTDLDEVNELLRTGVLGGRFRWAPFVQGGASMDQLIAEYAKVKSEKDEPTQDVRQKSPATFVTDLEKTFASHWPAHKGKIRTLYAILSDICHPSLGGDILFVEVPQREDSFQHRAEPHDEITKDFVRRIAMPILLDISQLTVWSLKRLGQVADSLREERDPTTSLPDAPET